MNVLNLINKILESIYYSVGIAGIILIYNTIKRNKEKEAKKIAKELAKSKKAYEKLKSYLESHIEKDEYGNNKKYSEVALTIEIKQYFSNNGDIKSSRNFKNIKDNNYDYLKDGISEFFDLFKKCEPYLNQVLNNNQIEKEFKEQLEEYITNTIIVITMFNFNNKYSKQIKLISKIIGVLKPTKKIFKNDLWKELCK